MTNNEKINKADKALDQAIHILNQLAYTEESTINENQRKYIDKAMKQITHAKRNLINAK